MATDEGELTIVARLKDSITPGLKKIMGEAKKTSDTVKGNFKGIQGALGNMKTSLGNVTKGFGDMLGKVVTLKGALVAFVGVQVAKTIVGQVQALVNYGDSIIDTSERLGIATGAMQEFQFAVTQNGVSTQEFEKSLERLNVNISESIQGVETSSEKFRALGVSVTDSNGKLKTTDVIFTEIADGLASIQDPALRTGMAMDLFGKAGSKLVPILSQGGVKINELREQAKKLGQVLDEDALKASSDFNDALATLDTQIKNAKLKILLPVIKDLTTAFQGAFQAISESDFASNGINKLSEVFTIFGKSVRVAFNILSIGFRGVSFVFSSFVEVVRLSFKTVVDIVSSGAKIIWDVLRGNLSGAMKSAKEFGAGLVDNIGTAFENLGNSAKATSDGIDQDMQDMADTVIPVAKSIKKELESIGGASTAGGSTTAQVLNPEQVKQYQDMIALAKSSAEEIKLITMDEVDVKISLQNKWYQEQKTIIGNAIEAKLAMARQGSAEEQAILEEYGLQTLELEHAHQMNLAKIGEDYAQSKIQPAIDLAERLKAMRAGEKELEIFDLTQKMMEERAILLEHNQSLADLESIHKDNLAQIEDKYHQQSLVKAQEHANKEEEIQRGRINNTFTLADALVSTGKKMAGLFKNSGKALKAFAIAEAVINTSRAITASLAPPPLGLGPVLGIPLAGLMGLKGAAEVASISAQKFATGGFPKGRNALIQVNEQGQESILNAGATQRLGAGNVNALNNNSVQPSGITNHISYAPTITIGEGSNTSATAIIEALAKDKQSFADFFKNDITRKGYLTFA